MNSNRQWITRFGISKNHFFSFAIILNFALFLSHSAEGAPSIYDHWRFFCEGNGNNKQIKNAKRIANSGGKSLKVAKANLNLGCLVHQSVVRSYEAQLDKWQKAGTGKQPTLNMAPAKNIAAKSKKILSSLHKKSKNPEVLYMYGYSLALVGDPLTVNIFDELMRNHPKSNFTELAYLALGEYYYDRGEQSNALREYKSAIRSKNPKIRSYTSYKLIWNKFLAATQSRNKKNQKIAISQMLNLHKNASRPKSPIEKLAGMIKTDLLSFLYELGDVGEAKKVLAASGNKEIYPVFVENLANGQLANGNIAGAYRLFASAYQTGRFTKDAPRLLRTLIELAAQLNNWDAVVKNLKFMVSMYGSDKSRWAKRIKDKKIIATSIKDTERMLFDSATTLDRNGRDTNNIKLQAHAISLYQLYIKWRPKGTRTQELGFYLGQLLFDRGQLNASIRTFLNVLKNNPKGKFAQPSADVMVTAAQTIFDNDKKKYPLAKPGEAKKPTKFPLSRALYAAALDTFIKVSPKNPNAGAMTYTVGVVYYDYGYYKDGTERLMSYIKNNPNGDFAKDAAVRVFHFHRVQKQDKEYDDRRKQVAKISSLRRAPELASYFKDPTVGKTASKKRRSKRISRSKSKKRAKPAAMTASNQAEETSNAEESQQQSDQQQQAEQQSEQNQQEMNQQQSQQQSNESYDE